MQRLFMILLICVLGARANADSFHFAAPQTQPLPRADSVAVADFAGDATNEIVVATNTLSENPFAEQLFIYRYAPTGMFELISQTRYGATSYTGSTGLAAVDVDLDGKTDVVVGHGSGVSVLVNLGNGVLAAPVLYSTPTYVTKLASIDVDQDGDADLAAAQTNGVVILRNSGLGTYTVQAPIVFPDSRKALDIEVGDLNSDGIADLGVLSDPPLMFTLRGLGSGGFQLTQTTYTAQSATVTGLGLGDLNGDRKDDVVINRRGNMPTWLWQLNQNELGILLPPLQITTYHQPETLESSDLNGDGLDDVVVLHSNWSKLGHYLQSTGALTAEVLTPTSSGSQYRNQSLAIGDVTGDGCPDVAIGEIFVGLTLHRGQACTGADGGLAIDQGVFRESITVSALHLSGPIEIRDPVVLIRTTGNARLRAQKCVELSSSSRTQQIFRCHAKSISAGSSMSWEFLLSGGEVSINATLSSASRDTDMTNNSLTRRL